MEEKRIFDKRITDSDDFVKMPDSSQALYVHLNMDSDEDGYTERIQSAMYKAHADERDLARLIDKKFVIDYEGGVIVIRDWRTRYILLGYNGGDDK